MIDENAPYRQALAKAQELGYAEEDPTLDIDGTDAAQNGSQPGYVDHTNYLTPAELRLVSEWLDIGGQFYNDPFVAPVAN